MKWSSMFLGRHVLANVYQHHRGGLQNKTNCAGWKENKNANSTSVLKQVY